MQQNSHFSSSFISGKRQASRSRSRDSQKKGTSSNDRKGRPSKKQIQQTIQVQKEQIGEQLSDSEYQLFKEYESSLPDDKNKTAFQMMEAVLTFFYQIGQKKGMVFDDQQRKYFRSKSNRGKDNRIKWTERHEWHFKKQTQKLLQVARLSYIDLQKQQMKYLVNTLLQVSSLFAQQFTSQLYKLLLNIWLIGKNKPTFQEMKKQQLDCIKENGDKETIKNSKDEIQQIQQRLKQLADRACNNQNNQYYFFSFTFKTIKDRNKKEDKQITKEDRINAYRTFVQSIHQSFKQM